MNNSLPSSEVAEKALLGAMLIDNERIPEVRQILPDAKAFYKQGHQRVYRALLSVYVQGGPADQVSVTEELGSLYGKTDLRDAALLVTGLMSETATGVHAVHHAEIVHEYAERQDAINVASQIDKMARDPVSDLEDIRSLLSERSFRPIGNDGTSERSIALNPRSATDLIKDSPEVSWQVEGILPVGSSAVLVGDAGVGKSWLALELAVAIDRGTPWLGRFATRQGRVLIIDEENADALLKRRLEKLLRGAGLPEDGSSLDIEFLTAQGLNLSDEEHVAALDRVFDDKQPDLVIIDSLVRIHRGNENDAGDMARLFAIIKEWMVLNSCSFVLCHHRRKPGLMGSDPATMFRGSTEIRAFVDTHLDLRTRKGERGLVTISHSKSRFAEPVAAFDVEIVDTAEYATVIRYVGESKSAAAEKLDDAQELILELTADGEWHSRQEILDKGAEYSLGRDVLDIARKQLIESNEVVKEKRGKATGIRSPERSVVPDLYKPEGTKERHSELSDEDLPDWVTEDFQASTECPEISPSGCRGE